jgi:hypothetical protein
MLAALCVCSVATCLGNSAVNPHLLNILSKFNVISEVVTDAQAITSCIKFAGLFLFFLK